MALSSRGALSNKQAGCEHFHTDLHYVVPVYFYFPFVVEGACDEIRDKIVNFGKKNLNFPTLHLLAQYFPTKYNTDKHRTKIFLVDLIKKQTKIVDFNFNCVFY